MRKTNAPFECISQGYYMFPLFLLSMSYI